MKCAIIGTGGCYSAFYQDFDPTIYTTIDIDPFASPDWLEDFAQLSEVEMELKYASYHHQFDVIYCQYLSDRLDIVQLLKNIAYLLHPEGALLYIGYSYKRNAPFSQYIQKNFYSNITYSTENFGGFIWQDDGSFNDEQAPFLYAAFKKETKYVIEETIWHLLEYASQQKGSLFPTEKHRIIGHIISTMEEDFGLNSPLYFHKRNDKNISYLNEVIDKIKHALPLHQEQATYFTRLMYISKLRADYYLENKHYRKALSDYYTVKYITSHLITIVDYQDATNQELQLTVDSYQEMINIGFFYGIAVPLLLEFDQLIKDNYLWLGWLADLKGYDAMEFEWLASCFQQIGYSQHAEWYQEKILMKEKITEEEIAHHAHEANLAFQKACASQNIKKATLIIKLLRWLPTFFQDKNNAALIMDYNEKGEQELESLLKNIPSYPFLPSFKPQVLWESRISYRSPSITLHNKRKITTENIDQVNWLDILCDPDEKGVELEDLTYLHEAKKRYRK